MLCLIESMAERYGMLPSDILDRGTTQDIMIYNNAHIIRVREEKKARGESIADTINQSELDDIWHKVKGKDGT